uniref:Uncharacterized protein n=1 Tax=Anguilla anguilla TaxID=7936 RepID=A0A0E9TTZ5_ANGAN
MAHPFPTDKHSPVIFLPGFYPGMHSYVNPSYALKMSMRNQV